MIFKTLHHITQWNGEWQSWRTLFDASRAAGRRFRCGACSRCTFHQQLFTRLSFTLYNQTTATSREAFIYPQRDHVSLKSVLTCQSHTSRRRGYQPSSIVSSTQWRPVQICFYFASGRDAKHVKYCDGLFVLYVCSLTYFKSDTSKLHKILYTCYLWLWHSPPLTTMPYIMYFRFCGWGHFCQ